MNLVKMKRVGDCGAACLAMVLGRTLAEVIGTFPERLKKGIGEREMVDYLSANGVPALSSMEWPSLTVPAILTVPSMNHPGLLHYVVWDGEKVLDPSHEEKRYPDDMPKEILDNEWVPPWATVILLWMPRD